MSNRPTYQFKWVNYDLPRYLRERRTDAHKLRLEADKLQIRAEQIEVEADTLEANLLPWVAPDSAPPTPAAEKGGTDGAPLP